MSRRGRGALPRHRMDWETLARLLATEPAAYDYIQSRRRRGIPAAGQPRIQP